VQRLELDLESDIMRANDILNGEVGHVHAGIVNFPQLFCVILCCGVTVLLGLRSRADHFTRPKDQCCRFGLSYTHDSSCKSFGLVFYVSSL